MPFELCADWEPVLQPKEVVVVDGGRAGGRASCGVGAQATDCCCAGERDAGVVVGGWVAEEESGVSGVEEWRVHATSCLLT